MLPTSYYWKISTFFYIFVIIKILTSINAHKIYHSTPKFLDFYKKLYHYYIYTSYFLPNTVYKISTPPLIEVFDWQYTDVSSGHESNTSEEDWEFFPHKGNFHTVIFFGYSHLLNNNWQYQPEGCGTNSLTYNLLLYLLLEFSI